MLDLFLLLGFFCCKGAFGTSTDNLQYVRVWHGGAIVGANNEINGITFGGVGSGTTVAHCEVACNADDAFAFFGGTVNVKYLSPLFFGDDGFDTDDGYVGKGQFLFAMLGAVGNHGCEMDSRYGSTPRSHPAFYGMTLVGASALSTRPGNAMMRLREGTGGNFGNLILANVATHPGIRSDTCIATGDTDTPPSIVSVLPASSVSLDTYLFFSSNNIIEGPTAGFNIASELDHLLDSAISRRLLPGNRTNTDALIHDWLRLFNLDRSAMSATLTEGATEKKVMTLIATDGHGLPP